MASAEPRAAARRWWPAPGKRGQGPADPTHASRYVWAWESRGSPGSPLFFPGSPQGDPGGSARAPHLDPRCGFLFLLRVPGREQAGVWEGREQGVRVGAWKEEWDQALPAAP